MKQKVFRILTILFITILLVFVYGFSANRNAQHKIKDIDIKIENNKHLYITAEAVNKMLKQKLRNLNSLSKDALFLNDLESALRTDKLVRKADVFVNIDGSLGVVIKQKIPIARVLNNKNIFYLDSDGGKMPLSQNYSATVPTISGMSSDANLNEVYKLADFVYKEPFLKGEVISINKNSNNEFELIIRDDNAVILVGSLDNLNRKSNNLKAYYLNAKQRKLTNRYKIINLKYSNQVVCTK